MIPQTEYANTREKLFNAITKNSIVLIPANTLILRNGDTHYPFRQSSDFYYLTGFNEPDAILALLPDHSEGRYILFTQKKDPLKEAWNGKMQGLEGVVENFGVDKAFDINEFEEVLPSLLENRSRIYMPIGQNTDFDNTVFNAVNALRWKIRRGVSAPEEFHDIEPILHEMRLYKSETEIATMRKATEISVEAHINAMKNCKPGKFEYELEAELIYTFMKYGSRSPAYEPIVGAGNNACILHYNENNAEIKTGDLILIDAGCEYQNYSSDLTRTFPANGKFSEPQKILYDMVLEAQLAAIDLIKPGTPWMALQDKIIEIYTNRLVELDILKGDVATLIEEKAVTRFYMHNSGHWLGLNTHDVGQYKVEGQWRVLEPGFVLTIEPGIYISENAEDVDEKWRGIGIRIEDDIVVTETGCDILSKNLPKRTDEIEALMRG